MTRIITERHGSKAPVSAERKAEPCVVVIFGASGDLTHRKLLPALWNLCAEGQLPESFSVVGVARTPKSDEQFRAEARQSVEEFSRFRQPDPQRWESFSRGLFYLPAQYDDPACYETLGALLERLCRERGSCRNHLFYLATPPSGYMEIIRRLGESGLARGSDGASPGPRGSGGWSRIVVEKPFGRDLESARALNTELRRAFDESQIYRIDHYLGKETVQNLMVFRFANGIFEPVWNRRYVEQVQITVAEEIGIEGRGKYYEETGALRDMVQNHLLQILCLIGMEPPARLNEGSVRNERLKVLEAVRPIPAEEVAQWAVRAQYGPGELRGRRVPGYREEPDVAPDSRAETFAALRLLVDNWRWAGVPFYLRTGKRLPRRATEVSIHFRQAPLQLFRDLCDMAPQQNVLAVRVQPNEGIDLCFSVKVPGSGTVVRPVAMHFDYKEAFDAEPPEAYERLLLDCMLGEILLFIRGDWMEAAWALIDPILRAWANDKASLAHYPAGSWGPPEAEKLLARDGHSWWAPG